jgi:hypothetical protein
VLFNLGNNKNIFSIFFIRYKTKTTLCSSGQTNHKKICEKTPMGKKDSLSLKNKTVGGLNYPTITTYQSDQVGDHWFRHLAKQNKKDIKIYTPRDPPPGPIKFDVPSTAAWAESVGSSQPRSIFAFPNPNPSAPQYLRGSAKSDPVRM